MFIDNVLLAKGMHYPVYPVSDINVGSQGFLIN